MYIYLIHSLDKHIAHHIHNVSGGKLKAHTTHYRIHTPTRLNLPTIRAKYQVDINLLPAKFKPSNIRAFVTDMDSTLINIECIDEIAGYAKLKEKVANITQQAMQGELDFNQSLRERVKLLTGLHTSVLEQVYNNKLVFNPGARKLMQYLQEHNIYTALVSGGFTYFSSRIQQELGFNAHLANTLEIKNNILTGKVIGIVINATQKAKFVESLPYNNSQVITCGDGANDLEMMKISGLSIAYHAKKVIKDYADIIIEFGGLDVVIDLFG